MRRRWIGLLGLLLLGLVIVAGVLWPWPTLPAPEKIDVPVTRLLVCPVGDPALGKTQVRVTDQEPFVAGVLGEVAGEPSIAVDLENPAKPVVVKGSSSVVGLSTYTESNLSMTAPCAAPVTSGTWSAVPVDDASASTLIMTNVDQASGVIDIFLYDQSGQLAVPGLSDIPVAGGQTVTLAIDHLVDSANPVAVVMRASKGRVAAVLRTIGSGGAQWVMPQRTADQDLVISGIPAGSGGRSLVLTNTSQTAPATVEVEVMSTEGSFAPMGLETVEVAPSHQLTWDLTDALGGQASGVHLISDQPVTAAVTVTEASTVSVISAQPSVGGQVVAPTLAGTAWLANPTDQAINVDIKSDDGSGALQTSTVVVEPGRILGTPWPTAGSDVRLTPDSPQLRVSLTPNDKPTTVLTLTGGGSASSVALAGLDPGLG